jgi:hypothetical protein
MSYQDNHKIEQVKEKLPNVIICFLVASSLYLVNLVHMQKK